MFAYSMGLLAALVMLGVGACLWRMPDPHHQHFASLLPLLDLDHSVGTPPVTQITSSEIQQHGPGHTRSA